MTTVKLLALWTGWCDACHVERPLALTEHGQHGLRAWFKGVGAEDRRLVLACEVCGSWQEVPQHEADEPAEMRAVRPAWPGQPTLTSVPSAAVGTHAVYIPNPRTTPTPPPTTRVLDLMSQGLDVVSPGPG